MLDAILEKKWHLQPMPLSTGIFSSFKVVKVLSYIEEITKSISCDAASVSLIIPFIQGLCLTLEKNDDSDRESAQ